MKILRWIYGTLLFGYFTTAAEAKSCHYNNLHATFGWTLVRSPGHPGRFPAQTQCWWKITAPPQYKVQLEFTDFSLVKPNSKNQCVWQWLNVIEGAADLEVGETPMLTLCGTSKPRIIISNGNALRLNLHSNAAAAKSTYRGFSARYKYTKDESYMPVGMSLSLPDSVSKTAPIPPEDTPSGVSRSVGSVIAPYAKPKRLPPNPNAVLTLKNRRTEEQNRQRNSGIATENQAANGAGGFTLPKRRRNPYLSEHQGLLLPRPMPTSTMRNEVLPPRRKPVPREVKILLAVLGTIFGIGIVIFLVKKFAFDKAHKRKPGEGKFLHAYAHFRHFKKKRKNNEDVEVAKVNTVSVGMASANGTLQSRDSGLSTWNDSPGLENGSARQSSGTNEHTRAAMECENKAYHDQHERITKRQGREASRDRGRHPEPTSNKQERMTREVTQERRMHGQHSQMHALDVRNGGVEKQRRRRHRRRSRDDVRPNMEASSRHREYGNRKTTRNGRDHEFRGQRARANHDARSLSSEYSDSDVKPSWRDRTYS